MSARQTQDQSPAPGRGRAVRAVLAIIAALFVAFDVACLCVLGFLIIGQTLGYLSAGPTRWSSSALRTRSCSSSS